MFTYFINTCLCHHGVYSILLLSKCNFTFFQKKIFTFQQKIFISKLVMYFIYKTHTRATRPSGKKYFMRFLQENIFDPHPKIFGGQMLRVPPPMWCVYNPSALELLNTKYVDGFKINQIFTLNHNFVLFSLIVQ